MILAILKDAFLVLILVHAIRVFLDERASRQPAELEGALTRRQKALILAAATFKAAARASPIGYYGCEMLHCLVG